MERPNWFDQKYGQAMEKATAEQALAEVAKDSRIVQAVKDALATHDARTNVPGPSRTQVIRAAIANTLQAQA